jgi:uncharacterized protein (DUF486 family)
MVIQSSREREAGHISQSGCFAALIFWDVALFNSPTWGTTMDIARCRIRQEVNPVIVNLSMVIFRIGREVRIGYLYAKSCLLVAVYFIFSG